MPDTPNIDILRGVIEEIDSLRTQVTAMEKGMKVLADDNRKHEAGLHRTLQEAVLAGALRDVWAHLGVDNQTDCMARLRYLQHPANGMQKG